MMNKCCCCGCDRHNDDAVGHVFDCRHFLCQRCLESFKGTPLRSVCFSCASPQVSITKQSFDSTIKASEEDKATNIVAFVDGYQAEKSAPTEVIYDTALFGIKDIFLSSKSRNKSCSGTEAGQSKRMEDKTRNTGNKISCGSSYPLDDFALVLREKKRELEAAESSFKEQTTLARKSIEKHAQMCRTLIDQDEKLLLQQLDEVVTQTLSENSASLSSIRSLIQRLEKADGEDGLEKEATDEVEQLLTTRINTVQFKEVSVYLNDICPQDGNNIVGELQFKPIPDHASFLSRPVLVGTLTPVMPQAVTGVTALDREIFVTRDGSQDISVYAVISNVYLRSLSLLKLLEPIVIPSLIDLAACSTTQCLYVADASNSYVFRLKTDGFLIHWWQVDNLRGLSVTTTGTVLIGSGKTIREYDPNGKLVRTISTSPLVSLFKGRERPSMRQPTHFLETDNGRIVVCDFKDARSPHVIYDVDRKGNTVTCWHGSRADSGDEFLNEPRHLAIDVTGHVMVVDRRNDRVKLLNAELRFVRDLLGSEQDVRRPQRLHYDQARGILYVGLVSGDVFAFRVTL